MRILALASALLAGPAFAADAPLGGRAAGMGQAYTSLALDASAAQWNPAGLAFLPNAQAALNYGGGDGALRHSAAAALPIGERQGAALAGEASQETASAILGFGRRLSDAASLGVSARYLASSADGRPRGFAADAAAFYRFDNRLTAGVAAANLGGRPEPLRRGAQEPQLRAGAGFAASRWLTYALDFVQARGGRAGVRSGLEAAAFGWMAARVGVDSTVEDSPAMGLTAGLGAKVGGHSLDLAYVPMGRRSRQQVSLVMRFGEPRALPSLADRPSAPARRPAAERRREKTERKREAVVYSLPPGDGFIQPAGSAAWDKPKAPEVPEKPETEPVEQPGMIWLQ